MPKAKALTVSCENRPGTLARLCGALGRAKVNLLACLATTSGPEGTVQLVVDNVNKAKKALDGAGFSYTQSDVLHANLANVPGALGKFAGKLAAKGVNINSAYATAAKGSRKASAVLGVSDLGRAARVR